MKGSCLAFCQHAITSNKHLTRRHLSSNVGPAASLSIEHVDATPTVGNMEPVMVTSVYEPIMPSTETILGMTLIVVLCAFTAWIWQSQVVPTARTNLAISKSRGPLKEYLDELKASDPKTRDKDLVETVANEDTLSSQQSSQPLNSNGRAMERWLFADWLKDNKSERRAGRQKEPALPILKSAKWNSGDNPVLVATLLIGLGVVLTAVTERVASLIS